MEQNKELFGLTNPQKSIWFMQQFYNNSVSNLTGINKMDIEINVEVLKKAINVFIQKNNILLARITMDKNEPKQYFVEYENVDIPVVELKDESELENLERKLSANTYSKLDEPPYTFYIFIFSDTKHGGFIFSGNHMCSDAWGTTLIGNQVVAIYENLLCDSQNEIYESSYITYIEDEKNYVNSARFQKDKEYWEDKFITLPQKASLAKVSNNKSLNTMAIRKSVQLNKEISDKINEYCKENNISPYVFFLSVYAIYLSRTNDLDKVIIGTPVLNRKNIEQKRTLGMFVNTLPIDIDFSNNITVRELFNEVSNKSLSLFKHQKYSYFDVLEYIRKKHQTSEAMYDVIFSYQNAKTESNNLKIPYSLKWAFNGNIPESINIHISDLDLTKQFNIYYDYQVEKFTDEDISDLHERIVSITNQIISNIEMIKDIDIVTNEEKENILNDTLMLNADYPKQKTVVDVFTEQVKKYPNNIAVKYEDTYITYKELNEKSNQLANFLKSKGIGLEDVISIRMRKSIEMIIGIIGIIKAGGCYLPIDLSYPKDRIDFMLKDSNAKLLLTDEQGLSEIDVNIEKVDISIKNNEVYNFSSEDIEQKILPDNLIYIIYTSGSTGIPKGVMLTHKNVVRLMQNDKFQFEFSDKDVWTMFHSVAFDFSVWEMYGALLYGGTLILVKEIVAKDPVQFLQLLRKEKVTVLNQTPTYFYNLLDTELKFTDSDLQLRYIVFGGEALKPSIIKAWKDKYPQTNLINMYGITETTVHVTFKELSANDLLKESSNIGKPIPTMKVYILDKNLKVLPYGVVGQICVTGDGLGRGYLNRPELNETKFIDNPYIQGEKLYLSGDSGYLDKSGDLYYKERIDTQVKIRGYRVELGEIETKLLSYPYISKCIVLAQKKTEKDSQLVAYIICNNDFENKELRQYLSNILPTYMIPSFFVKIDKFPLNSNGKVDRKKLQELNTKINNNSTYVEPSSQFEKDFCQIVTKALGYEKISVEEDIIELGADSLTLMKITTQLLEKGYVVNIQDIYEKRNIRSICGENKEEIRGKEDNANMRFEFSEEFSQDKIKYDNVFLTGVTGFIGIHILYELIQNTQSTVFCLVRQKNGMDIKQRLEEKLQYYFNGELIDQIGSRIILVEGDVELTYLGIDKEQYAQLVEKIDVVVHAAAMVSHYGDIQTFENININGTKNICDFCKANDILLNYISTISVLDTTNDENNCVFDEHMIYSKQQYNKNVYIRTKYEAEKYVYEQMNEGLKVGIYRLGNIMARIKDNVFQQNYEQNAFLNRVITFAKAKAIPQDIATLLIDITPVDECSNIIVNLIQYRTSYNRVFHIVNNNKITVKELFNLLDIQVNETSMEDLSKTILQNDKNNIVGIINDITANEMENHKNTICMDITMKYLDSARLSFSRIDKKYINGFINKYL